MQACGRWRSSCPTAGRITSPKRESRWRRRPPFSTCSLCSRWGRRSSPTGWTSVPRSSYRRGQHVARADRHPLACHRAARAGSTRRPVTVDSTPPKPREGVFPARRCRARGHCADGAPAGLRYRVSCVREDLETRWNACTRCAGLPSVPLDKATQGRRVPSTGGSPDQQTGWMHMLHSGYERSWPTLPVEISVSEGGLELRVAAMRGGSPKSISGWPDQLS